VGKLSESKKVKDRDWFRICQNCHARLDDMGAIYEHLWAPGDVLAISRRVFHYRLLQSVTGMKKGLNGLYAP